MCRMDRDEIMKDKEKRDQITSGYGTAIFLDFNQQYKNLGSIWNSFYILYFFHKFIIFIFYFYYTGSSLVFV